MLDSFSSDLTNLASLNSVQVDRTESLPLKRGGAKCKGFWGTPQVMVASSASLSPYFFIHFYHLSDIRWEEFSYRCHMWTSSKDSSNFIQSCILMGQLTEIIIFSLKQHTSHGAASYEPSQRNIGKFKYALGRDLGVLTELCYILKNVLWFRAGSLAVIINFGINHSEKEEWTSHLRDRKTLSRCQ